MMMLKTYKILALLLSYPTQGIQELLNESLREIINENLLPESSIRGIRKFTDYYSKQDLTDWQAHYVQIFDYSRTASLHLFEHVQGDSKDRGQAMVDLIDFYRENGLEIATNELPDHLAVFLEFLSTLQPGKGFRITGRTG
ncbi:MAG: nitrate reductase molybdenum cofactor assembly chaperone [Bacteroidales bacterium]|nr:nitrate reductase molybdenum cofactor assembly chaperone [Bacteroidales bacterium]